MYLVDTNVISEVRKRERANQGVRTFFRRAVRDESDLYLSVVTIAELRRGVELIRHRGDMQQVVILEAWLGGVLGEYTQNILSVNEEIAQLWGHLRAPHPEHALDKLIAATALIHDLTVVTRNVDDFARTGVRLLNPFE
ncbi:type II toxin-antitoxin system VapC family toxin [Trinickia fusca]|uniref:Ribonuclease VapC n=1 Tax=Trinickia fusca TaxID=2419777 RepID=A0A494X689_9BURK|nr:type II toxin-antitoxin system VapC family toxin [Trinickia fusca]RKP45920.1 type II toxin-antitoxin system VapC family toxin [Trinickia fusca]